MAQEPLQAQPAWPGQPQKTHQQGLPAREQPASARLPAGVKRAI
ncbi:MAG TPA: hypothetical protein VN310_03225 [Candidatus Dormibacteraeota bacterium]|nr:hypothetical protein [Candidatus Dormibacteraeota bacterium]